MERRHTHRKGHNARDRNHPREPITWHSSNYKLDKVDRGSITRKHSRFHSLLDDKMGRQKEQLQKHYNMQAFSLFLFFSSSFVFVCLCFVTNTSNVCNRCELNSASHLDYPSDFVDNENAEYHVRESFSIDPVCVLLSLLDIFRYIPFT